MKQPWIFVDFDGTAVDTLSMLRKAFFQFGKEVGVRFTNEDFERANGPSIPEVMKDVKKRFSLKRYSVNELISLHDKYERECYLKAKPRPDLRRVLLVLRKQGWKCALVTSGQRSIIQDFFKKYHWDEIFDFAVTGDEVNRAKPHPDLYLLAKNRAGGEGPFLAIEDSLSGIKSAKLAGCIALRFAQRPQEKRFFGVSSFHELQQGLRLIDGNAFLMGDKHISFEAGRGTLPNPYWPWDNPKKMAEVWLRATKKNSCLFDGLIFAIEEETQPFSFSGKFVRYRHIYPQFSGHGAAYPILVAVSVITHIGKTIVISRRSRAVTQFPERWEFAPAGSVGSTARSKSKSLLNLEKQIREELEEEFGITDVDPRRITQKTAVLDLNSRIIEVIYKVSLPKHAMVKAGEEHTRHTCVSPSVLKKMLMQEPEQFVPIAQIMAKL